MVLRPLYEVGVLSHVGVFFLGKKKCNIFRLSVSIGLMFITLWDFHRFS